LDEEYGGGLQFAIPIPLVQIILKSRDHKIGVYNWQTGAMLVECALNAPVRLGGVEEISELP
jgi:hypothetical protein|tara:strand:- start:12 stop:197 length:186 start_codon:yes stop_codon:yes gene_type:complete